MDRDYPTYYTSNYEPWDLQLVRTDLGRDPFLATVSNSLRICSILSSCRYHKTLLPIFFLESISHLGSGRLPQIEARRSILIKKNISKQSLALMAHGAANKRFSIIICLINTSKSNFSVPGRSRLIDSTLSDRFSKRRETCWSLSKDNNWGYKPVHKV